MGIFEKLGQDKRPPVTKLETGEKLVVKQAELPALADQPSARPTEKWLAGGITGIVFTLGSSLLFRYTGIEITKESVTAILVGAGSAQTIVMKVIEYFKRDRAKEVVPS